MVKRADILGSVVEFEGAARDVYFKDLPDGGAFSDPVLDFLAAVLDPDSNATVLDVGANIGVHALALALRSPGLDVTAVEANPTTAGWLEGNVRRNGVTNVRVVRKAVSDEPGSLSFCDNREFAAGSMSLAGAAPEFQTILSARDSELYDVIEVPAVRIDDLVEELHLPTVDVLKIDIEGHDIRAVRGAEATIESFRPVVVMEFATLAITLHAGMLPSDVLRDVRSRFESVYVVTDGGGLHEIVDDEGAVAFLAANATQHPVQDLVCVPHGCPRAEAVAARRTSAPARTRADYVWDLEQELAEARRLNSQFSIELSALRERAAHADAMEGTVSWKVTRPLRVVRTLLAERRARR